jgi:uncharacterized membrane protein
MSTSADKLIDDYLDRLERELAEFPAARRRELVQEISEHIAEARAGLEPENEAEIRNVLDRLGDPADIAAEARGSVEEQPAAAAPAPERRSGALEVLALVLILLGGVVVPVIGWLVGVVLLWISSAWTARQKLLGTLVVPGGLALPAGILLFATSSESACYQQPFPGGGDEMICSSGSIGGQILGSIVVALLGAASIATVIYLGRRMGRNTEVAAA